MEQYSKTTTVLNSEGEEDYYVINPSKKELIQLLGSDVFEELGKFKKIE